MNDLKKFTHGSEGTHFACREAAKEFDPIGCCACNGHECLVNKTKPTIKQHNHGIFEDCIEDCPPPEVFEEMKEPTINKECTCQPDQVMGTMLKVFTDKDCPIHGVHQSEHVTDTLPTGDMQHQIGEHGAVGRLTATGLVCTECGEPIQGESNSPEKPDSWESTFDELFENNATMADSTKIVVKGFIRKTLRADRTHLIQEVEKLPSIWADKDIISRRETLEILKK